MGIQKKVVAVRLAEDFIEEVRRYAELENRNMSNFIETALKEYIRQNYKNENEQAK